MKVMPQKTETWQKPTNKVEKENIMFHFQGSCFPPSFGGKCSGIPFACQPCLEPCKSYTGKIITVNLNDRGKVRFG